MTTPAYSGSITTTGSSEAVRLDKALFRQHPEFRQKAKVTAHVIGHGMLLLHLAGESEADAGADAEGDPMVAAYLAFLERDVLLHPEVLEPLTVDDVEEADELVKGVEVSDDDVIPDDITL